MAAAPVKSPPKRISNGQTDRLKSLYIEKFTSELKAELGYKNITEVPRLEKIVVSVGLGRSKDDKKMIEAANNTLRKITGQQPVQTKAKKAIASFKLRAGSTIGAKVTLRDKRMYEFIDRLITVVLPRVRDFHGVPLNSFDLQGNYSLGLSEQAVFPELTFEDTVASHGVQITLHIKGKSPADSKLLLQKLGLPFVKEFKQKLEEN